MNGQGFEWVLIIFIALIVACMVVVGVFTINENQMRQDNPEMFIPKDFCRSQHFSSGSIQNLSNEKYVLCNRYVSGGMFSSGHKETEYFSKKEFDNRMMQGANND